MGDTRRFAERMDLIHMLPRGELTSTDLALATPGREYLLLEPSGDAKPFTVELAPGRYDVEWFSLKTDGPGRPIPCTPTGALASTPPFDGPAVLYLKADGV